MRTVSMRTEITGLSVCFPTELEVSTRRTWKKELNENPSKGKTQEIYQSIQSAVAGLDSPAKELKEILIKQREQDRKSSCIRVFRDTAAARKLSTQCEELSRHQEKLSALLIQAKTKETEFATYRTKLANAFVELPAVKHVSTNMKEELATSTLLHQALTDYIKKQKPFYARKEYFLSEATELGKMDVKKQEDGKVLSVRGEAVFNLVRSKGEAPFATVDAIMEFTGDTVKYTFHNVQLFQTATLKEASNASYVFPASKKAKVTAAASTAT